MYKKLFPDCPTPLMNSSSNITIVIPIYNEEKVLQNTIKEVIEFLSTQEYNYSIIIADNNSTDSSGDIAIELSETFPQVNYLHLPRKGRGFALRNAWKNSNSEVLVYMDVDLSSPLKALPDLINPILNNEADITFGSRLKKPHGQAVDRKVIREITSRGYNFLLQFFMGAEFQDAQCGFKAISKKAFNQLEPHIQNETWFFDSELLLIGQYTKLKLKEIGIRWIDDPFSSVNIVDTALENIKEMWRVYWIYKPQSLFRKLFSFGIIGILSTLGQALLFLTLRIFLSSQIANLISLIILTLLNTLANKRISFKNKSTEKFHHVFIVSVISFLVFWIPTSASLWFVHEVLNLVDMPTVETTAIIASSLIGTLLKYVVLSYVYTPKKVKKQTKTEQ